jgi:hypothetical protein
MKYFKQNNVIAVENRPGTHHHHLTWNFMLSVMRSKDICSVSIWILLLLQFWDLSSEPHTCWTVALPFEPLCQPFFCVRYFQDRVLWTICPDWLQTVILLISARVARIICVSHWCRRPASLHKILHIFILQLGLFNIVTIIYFDYRGNMLLPY